MHFIFIVETTVNNSDQLSLFLYPIGFHRVLCIHFCVIVRMYTLYDRVVFVTVRVMSVGRQESNSDDALVSQKTK